MADDDVPPEGDRLLTIPNLLSLVRLACIPLFVYLLFGPEPPRRVAAAYLLAVLGATDWVDGYVARHFNQVSAVGKVLDPTADRLMLITAVVCIWIDDAAPKWVLGAAVAREVVVGIAALALAAAGARRMDVTWFGKAGTFALMFAFPLYLGGHSEDLWWQDTSQLLAWCFAVPGLVLSYYAAVMYIPMARDALKEGRVGSAS